LDDDAIRGLTVIKDGTVTWPAPPLKQPAAPKPAAAAPPRPRRRRAKGHGSGEPMSAKALAIVFAVGALAFLLVGLRAGVPVALHGVRAGLLHRLHGDLERHAVAAHAADERDQRDLVDHRHRRAGADRAAAEPAPPAIVGLILGWRWRAVLTAINMFGGFAVTRRMLAMFRK
jgi:NAD(P) transhydrogenase subunit alpha